MHEDDARILRRFAIREALSYTRASGGVNVDAALVWAAVAVYAGADKEDLALALGWIVDAVQEKLDHIRSVAL